MSIKDFIEKAIEGGWNAAGVGALELVSLDDGDVRFRFKGSKKYASACIHEIALDPDAWRAVGKVEGWKTEEAAEKIDPTTVDGVEVVLTMQGWYVRMHRLIDALAEGKTIEQFLESL